jgi:hypothetical protein
VVSSFYGAGQNSDFCDGHHILEDVDPLSLPQNTGGYPMFRAFIAAIALLLLAGPASAFDLVVINEANFSIIHKLYIAPAKSQSWSDEKLQNQKVKKNGRFTIRDIAAGVYDLKVVDDDDDSCVFSNISIDQNKEWKLTDMNMIKCVFTGK